MLFKSRSWLTLHFKRAQAGCNKKKLEKTRKFALSSVPWSPRHDCLLLRFARGVCVVSAATDGKGPQVDRGSTSVASMCVTHTDHLLTRSLNRRAPSVQALAGRRRQYTTVCKSYILKTTMDPKHPLGKKCTYLKKHA